MSAKYFQVGQGVWGLKQYFVNVYMIANRRSAGKGWVLVDTGIKGSEKEIIAAAEKLFGPGTKPAAIVLTHGHADHTGSIKELLKYWDVPVYAHKLEMPYLTGRCSYPPVDPFAGGGLMGLLSWIMPVKPINISRNLREIDMYEGIPELPEWKIIHTPGHTPGHISLFLPLNTTLIAGDAITTTVTESAVSLLGNLKQIAGPPKYTTTDWKAAEQSVQDLTELQPRIAATGHGPVMRGRELTLALSQLAENFGTTALPESGRYVKRAAIADERGVRYIPPAKVGTKQTIGFAAAASVAAFLLVRSLR